MFLLLNKPQISSVGYLFLMAHKITYGYDHNEY